jgi:hypothetical protein
VATNPTFDALDSLIVALTDIRAALDAQLRLVSAAQVCVEYRRKNSRCESLEDCAEYLDRTLKTNDLLAPAMRETLSAVRATAASS